MRTEIKGLAAQKRKAFLNCNTLSTQEFIEYIKKLRHQVNNIRIRKAIGKSTQQI